MPPNIHNSLAEAVRRLGQGDARGAARAYERARMAAKPDDFDTAFRLGVVAARLGRTKDAGAWFARAAGLDPDRPEVHHALADTLAASGEFVAAANSYRRALDLAPDNVEARNNLGNALLALDRVEAAAACFEAALAHAPGDARLHFNLGNALKELNRYEAAIGHYDRALALEPKFREAAFNRALALLVTGDFRQGWPAFESRWGRRSLPHLPDYGRPLWLGGEPIRGATLLVQAEQGLGDTIHFLRFLPALRAQCASLIAHIPEKLLTLAARSLPMATFAGLGEAPPPFDARLPLLSAPLALGAFTEAEFPAPGGYLSADPARVAEWRERLGPLPRPRVGFAWKGNPAHEADRQRSMPLEHLKPLLERTDIGLVSLQFDPSAAEETLLRSYPHVLPLRLGFEDMAAVTASLDLIVTVDTVVAHLAGALGRPVRVMLPFKPDWRWLLGRADCPWYASARLYRQAAPGNWPGVVRAVMDDIAGGGASRNL